VTIYGQSWGRVQGDYATGMSPAEGLIHRASAQSGGGGNPPGIEESSEYSKRVIAELGVRDMAGLQKVEWARLNEVSNSVAAKMNPPMGMGSPTPAPGTARPRVAAGPTVDGRTITLRSFYDVVPEISLPRRFRCPGDFTEGADVVLLGE
jgi:para-nitrobenzyl esterase